MQSKAATVAEYLASLPADRRDAVEAVRRVILKNIDKGFQETMQYGMIGYSVPHSVFPAGYHCDPRQPLPFAGLASQKQHMSLYIMGIYMDSPRRDWFIKAWKDTGKKLDMGAACIRFKKIEDVPLDVVAEAFKRMSLKGYVEVYEANLAKSGSKPRASKSAAKKTAVKKKTATPGATKKASKVAKKKLTRKT
jgi:hypothetical protein